ncbi:MAG: Spy/CpxP family protein refolding chaperone [Bdellovibrionales bacterium]
MKTKKLLTLGGILGFFVWGLISCSAKTPEEKVKSLQKKVTNRLDLRADQSEQFQQLAAALVDAREKLKADRYDLYSKTEDLLNSDQITADQIMNLINPKLDLIKKEAPKIAEQFAKFHNTLSKEQKSKLVKFVAKAKKHHLEN